MFSFFRFSLSLSLSLSFNAATAMDSEGAAASLDRIEDAVLKQVRGSSISNTVMSSLLARTLCLRAH